MAEAKPTEDPNTLSVSHADLKGRGRPAGWTVEKHADHDETGMLVVTAPPAIAGLGLLPGQQINYERDDDGNVLAWSTGPHENPGEAARHITPVGNDEPDPVPPPDYGDPTSDEREILPGRPTPTSPTPQPQAASTPYTDGPQASSTAQVVTLQHQSETSPSGIGLDDVIATELTNEAVVAATDDLTMTEEHQRAVDGGRVDPDLVDIDALAEAGIDTKRAQEDLHDQTNGEKGTNPVRTFPEHTGGGWYDLSNGEKVQGKKDAEKAQAKLDKA